MILDPLIITYGLVVCILILIGWIVRLETKIHRLLRGKDAKSLEDSIVSSLQNLDKLNTFQREAISYFENIEARLGRSVQAIETIRFNPFRGEGVGGNQSFSTSFINEKGDGVVFSSLYSRDRVSIFSKPLQKFESNFELTEEEKEAVGNARKNLNN